ncbi:phage tail sheath family protein [Streptomyces palmae]|uniref:Phage tail sheath family protein n=1 Tax=Streptomyces palmae TaxID=1701085 RepID=A0A4Z0H9L9_9ACTN|nr:phage tail sheath C-terminal domain-containing protein [Streptomyces palmae]TGB06952.1 phage tail sheath family protein [Streptomyces palmae]
MSSAALAPGVYVKEVPSGMRTISGSGTSTPAFLGYTLKSPDGQESGPPVLVRGWREFVDLFWYPQGLVEAKEKLRLAEDANRLAQDSVDALWESFRKLAEKMPPEKITRLKELNQKRWNGEITEEEQGTLKALEGEIPGAAEEAYRKVGVAGDGLIAAGEKVTSWNSIVTGLSGAENWRLADAVSGFFANGGASCYIVPLSAKKELAQELAGDPDKRTGLAGLKFVREVSMVAVPDLWTLGPQEAVGIQYVQLVVAHCVEMCDRVAIVDPPPTRSTAALRAFIDKLPRTDEDAAFTTVYYPWATVIGTVREVETEVPVCGHVAGVWARTDAERGVFKAPANQNLRGITGLPTLLTDPVQGELNELGVNCLRSLPGQGYLVWGARTRSTSRDWKYLNVRRLVCFLAESIRTSSTWAVFEPNDERLWATLRYSVETFLTDQWRRGALQGRTTQEAFSVTCDGTSNTPETIDQGKVICDIGVAPVRPAEFVHFTITQITGRPGQTG